MCEIWFQAEAAEAQMWLSGVFLFRTIVQMCRDKIIRVYVHNINGIDSCKRFMIIPILFYIQASSAAHDMALFCIPERLLLRFPKFKIQLGNIKLN